MSCARPTAALILGCLCVMPACAQHLSCQRRTIPVSIASTDTTPLRTLSSVDFKGSYQRKPVSITSATVSQESPRVVILLDASGSMQRGWSNSEWKFAVGIGEDLVAGLPPTTEIGLAFFSTKPIRIATPTNEREKLKNQLNALRTDTKALPPEPRKTALWDAIIDSLYMFDNPRLGDAIYVITDGHENASSHTSKDTIQTLGAVGVRLFAFIINEERLPPAPEKLLSAQNLLQIIEDTGGTSVDYRPHYSGPIPFFPGADLFDKSDNPTRAGLLLAAQARQMLSFYRLDIDLPSVVDKPREWKLDLVGLGKSQREALVLTYPHILLPCQ
jgi:VWA domain-containing protein